MAKWICVAAFLALGLAGCGSKSEGSAQPVEGPAVQDVIPSAELRPCEVLRGRRVSASDCEDAARTNDKVHQGMASFNWPKTLRRAKPVVLRLAIGEAPPEPPAIEPAAPSPAAAETQAPEPAPAAKPDDPTAAAPAPSQKPRPAPPNPADAVKGMEGEVTSYYPFIGEFMSARLTGDGFKIERASGEEHQELAPNSVNIWEWRVTPLAGGDHNLTITTQVEFKDSAGRYVPLQFAPETRVISVTVPWWMYLWDSFGALFAWLPKGLQGAAQIVTALTALIGALTGLVIGWRKLRSATRAPTPPPATS